MNAYDYYTELYLAKVGGEERQFAISIAECAEIFYCSARNAKLIIHKLENLSWIQWRSGRGRGNKSQIHFLKELDTFVKERINALVSRQQLDQALAFLQAHTLPQMLANQCWARVKKEFGYQTNQNKQKEQDILRIPINRQLTTLDPARAAITTESHLSRQIFDCLVNYKVDSDTFVPHLAHYWEHALDRTEWRFYLRKGVYFHSGHELTARDVVFTVQRIADPVNHLPCHWYFDTLLKVRQLHRYVVALTFSKPTPALLYFSSLNLAILASDTGYHPKQMIGTGPFKIVHSSNQLLLLARFADYFRERALLDRIELYVAPKLVGAKKMYDVPQIQADHATHAKRFEEKGSSYMIYNLNKSGPLQDKWLRLAMNTAIDRNKMLRELGGDRYCPSNSFIPNNSERGLKAVGDAKRIEECLGRSVYQGERLKLYYFNHQPVAVDAAWIKNALARFGVCLEPIPWPMDQFYNDQFVENADIILGGEVLEENVDLGLIHLFKDQSSLIRRMLDPKRLARVDQFMDLFIQAGTAKMRKEAFKQLEMYLNSEQLLIYLYHSRKEITFNAALSGIRLNAFGWAEFSKLWIKPSSSAEKLIN
ncbi:ABC transporter substrate-binding protein [Sporolactobacillus inulinus]|uniref:ABC transporter substrate-binding protein n=1 Tax=Sporolactobacillus inulinus CASD TaxID=1069536 RepID=A0A0U1QS46_9BACL|nr:ABC transporter substrate-binding protein [Sporolactobacillus inulinus]KLI03620.1 hypothetical protein SINU_01605 [Sporolactobacillus inulinus CASD]GEB76466.1 ABC transporter substrate-binding protein [Sporolactobacillus inulinus]